MLRREVMKLGGGLFGLGAGTPSRFPYPGRPQPSPAVGPSSATIVRANRVIVTGPGGGIYVYSGPPASGNLIESIGIVSAGFDPFHLNAVLAGDTRYHNNGVTFVAQNSAQSLIATLWQATSALGPYVNTSIQVAFAGDFTTTPILQLQGNTIQLIGLGSATELFVFPTGDTTGAKDLAAINFALTRATSSVRLVPGVYYVNAPVQVPAHSFLRGAGRDAITVGANATIIQAVGSIGAVIASASWVTNAGTGQNGGQVRDLQVNGNGTAVNGIVFQTEDALIENVQVLNCTTNGIAFSVLCADGVTAISGNLSNNQVNRCVVTGCPGRGIATLEHAGSDVFTDGFITWCVVNACGFGIGLDQAADWQIVGNHLYTLAFDGMYLGDCFNTHVHHNEIDQWGGFAGAAINARGINAVSVSSFGGVSVFTDNVVWMGSAPGNAGSVIEGINFGCQPAQTACLTATGNQAWMQPAAGFASATPFIATNAAATSIMNLQTTGNFAFGHWGTPNWTLVPAGGTITHTAGV